MQPVHKSSSSPRCPVCRGVTEFAFCHKVLRDYNAHYAICRTCEFIAATPADWLEEAYASAMASTDTGAVVRNEGIARYLATFAWLAGLGRLRGLDVGGGHGLLVRMLRDRGLDFRWSDKYAENIFARGFEDDSGGYSWLTLVEVFEHLVAPFEYFQSLIATYSPRCVFFTTELKPSHLPPLDWAYWSFETGQHVGFASMRSLALLAERLGYRLTSNGHFHLYYQQPRYAAAFQLAASPLRRSIGAVARFRLGSLTLADNLAAVRSRRP